jgi:hypothetical protein
MDANILLGIRDILNPAGKGAVPLISTKNVPRDKISDIDPYNQNVEFDLTAGDFVTGDTLIIMSGPPTLDMAINTILRNTTKPIGLVINASIQTSKMSVPWDELSSNTMGTVPVKVIHNLSLSRIRSNQNSLNYALYRWLVAELQSKTNIDHLLYGSEDAFKFLSYPGFVAEKTLRNNQRYVAADKHYDNLGSEFFCFPFGLFTIELDQYMNLVTAMYFENCSISGNQRTISEQPLVVEGVQIQAKTIKPAFGFDFNEIQKYAFSIKDDLAKGFASLSGGNAGTDALTSPR